MPVWEYIPRSTGDPIWQKTESKGAYRLVVRASDQRRAQAIINKLDVPAYQPPYESPWDDDEHCTVREIANAEFAQDGPEELLEPSWRERDRKQAFGV